jgi:putative flippase GtrA
VKSLAGEMLRYIVGALVALAVDVALVSLMLYAGSGVFVSRVIGLTAGVTITYFFNRRYTFATQLRPSLREWATYAATQSIGTAINFGVSLLVLSYVPKTPGFAALAISGGAIAGFSYNFFAARRVLQRNPRKD